MVGLGLNANCARRHEGLDVGFESLPGKQLLDTTISYGKPEVSPDGAAVQGKDDLSLQGPVCAHPYAVSELDDAISQRVQRAARRQDNQGQQDALGFWILIITGSNL